MKTEFELDFNSAYPEQMGLVSIIGQLPKTGRPYLSILFADNLHGQIAHGWIKDKDLELLAVNILKALNSKKLKT